MTDENSTTAVALGFVNADAHLDAVFANSIVAPPGSMRNRLRLGDGMGAFTCTDLSADEDESRDVALGFVNADAHLDAVFGNWFQTNRACLGNGTGAFICVNVSADEKLTTKVAVGEFSSLLFADGFESGDLSRWAASVP